ncbi:MAG: nitroreductase family protein [Amylibacter sp.]
MQQNHRDLHGRIDRLSDDAIDLILRDARSHYAWTDKPVTDAILQEIFEITINGATSMNTLPVRIVFVKSPEGKERLAKAMKPMNVPKMMGAPVTAIIAHDLVFLEGTAVFIPSRRPSTPV